MRKYDGLIGSISILLVIAMLIGLGSVLVKVGFAEPENPIAEKTDPLVPEALDGGGNLIGNDIGEQDATMPPEETEPPTEPEETEPPTEPEETEPPTEPEETEPPTEPEETEPPTEPEETESPTEPDGEQDPTTPPKEPSDPEPGPNEDVGETEPGDDDGGNGDTDEDEDGPAGDDGDGPGEGGDTPGEGDDDSPKIVTNLENLFLTREELPEGILKFYAYPSVDDEALSIKVVVNNSATPANGSVLTSPNHKDYEAALVLNETTTITLYLKENGENLAYVRYQIRYETEKADEEHPEQGDNPPSIITNLDGFTDTMDTQDFLFWVSARTNPEGDPIYSNQIQVWLNGQLVHKQTGDERPEYELHFEPPNVGDTAKYTVKVLAWDGKGNSIMKVYTVNYQTVSEGDYLGEVRVVLDATTVGLGIIDSATYEIVQGDTAAGVVIKFLEDHGYDAVYSGSSTVGFYLRSISRGDLCYGAKVPDRLWELILRDGIALSNPAGRDSLGEYDYTMGSGWMYSINGSIYPNRGLSEYKLSKNTTIYLRFTLSYGKDVGGSGQGKGSLAGYCGVWINGGYTPYDHSFEETERQEATETEDGFVKFTCAKCGEKKEEILPMTGEPTEPEETEPSTEPEETEPSTEPEETEPSTEPEETEPSTEPEETEPSTEPEETEPSTQPEETVPPTTLPPEPSLPPTEPTQGSDSRAEDNEEDA